MRNNFELYGSRCIKQLGNNLLPCLKTRLRLSSMSYCTQQDWGKLSQLSSLGQTNSDQCSLWKDLSISLLLLLCRFCALYIYTLCNCRNRWDLEERGHNPFILSSDKAQPSPATPVPKLAWCLLECASASSTKLSWVCIREVSSLTPCPP